MEQSLKYLMDYEENEKQWQEDYKKLHRCYPKEAKMYYDLVSEALDRLEYEDSMMYRESVDEASVQKLAMDLGQKIGCSADQMICYPLLMVLLLDEIYVRRMRKCRHQKKFRENSCAFPPNSLK